MTLLRSSSKTILAFLVFGLFLYSSHSLANKNIPVQQTEEVLLEQELEKLNKQYQSLIQKVYLNSNTTGDYPKYKKLSQLIKSLKRLKKTETPEFLVATISANLNLIKNNLEHNAIDDIAWLLYRSNAIFLADKLLQLSIESYNDVTAAAIYLQQAKYYATAEDWPKVINSLQQMELETLLEKQEVEFAYILMGIALQNLQQHRDAIKIYNIIPSSSSYYSIAQYNSAVANLRQGWWTDAYFNLDAAEQQNTKAFELIDQFNTVRGFSQIQYEFYRNARESFHKIGLQGNNVNRALLGLGLTAMHQKDFIGALNAFSIIANKNELDAFALQAQLLIPYTHEKLGQQRLAEAKYNEATIYYQQYINIIQNTQPGVSELPQETEKLLQTLKSTRGGLAYNPSNKDFSKPQNNFVEKSLNRLPNLKSLTKSSQVKQQTNQLEQKFWDYQKASYTHKSQYAISVIQSYLNQCQYALARLYDENQ